MTTSLMRNLLLAGLCCFAAPAFTQQGTKTASRGELLYATHCIECHTAQVHWRDERRAHDWDSLKDQVRRWQGTASLGWTDADIVEVARHLNTTIYRFPQTSDRLSLAR